MNQNDYPSQGMKGYGQPNSYFQNPSYRQTGVPGQEYFPFQNAQPQPPTEGYRAPAGQGYSSPVYQQRSGYTTPQVPFIQAPANSFAPDPQQVQLFGSIPVNQGNPYAVPPGYSSPAQNVNPGSFIPQTPYSPGYTSPGYQPPQQGYQAGYNPYGQMGRTQNVNPAPEYNPSIPLNGGGYVPQKVPVKRKPFAIKDWHLIAMGAFLVVLFVFAVIVTKNPALKIAVILLAAGSAGVLWIKHFVAENKRLTYSIVAMALSVLTAVSFLMKSPSDATKNGTNSGQIQANSSQTSNTPQEIPASDSVVAQNTQTDESAQKEVADSNITDRLIAFFNHWANNRQDEMLLLCSPSWVSKQENPRSSLFTLLANRRTIDCTLESITGTDADNSRKITLTSKIDRNNGKDPELYRMTVLMVKENNEWYVDPQSLQSFDTVATPDPSITAAPTPTEEPAIYPTTTLYYNPNKGEYYHLDPYCRNVGKQFTPLAGQFTYAEINDEPYSKLKPCNVCGAPLRP